MTATKSAKYKRLQESTAMAVREIDRTNGVIRDVKVLGLESRNGRRYSKDAAARAIPLYEGVKVCIDHNYDTGLKSRKTGERWGVLRGIRQDAAGDLFGDLHYLKTHSQTETILEQLERFGDCGLSHDADGLTEKTNDGYVVVDIRKVFTVDFVLNPATNQNLWESEQIVKRKLREVLQENIENKVASNLLARLVESKQCESTEMDMQEGEDPLNAALRAAIMEVLDGDASVEDKLSSIRGLCGGGASSEAPAETEMAEDTDLRAENERLREELAKRALEDNRKSCISMLKEAGREATDVQVDALLAIPADKRQHLVESFAVKVPSKPQVSPPKYSVLPLKESRDAAADTLKDAKLRLGLN